MKEEEYESCWWKVDGDWIYVYTEDIKKIKKLDLKPMANYSTRKNLKKHFAYQYKVEKNSKEYKKIFKTLGLTDKNQYKIKGHKNGGADGENIAKNKK